MASVSEGLLLTVAQIAATLIGLLLVGMFFYLEAGFRRLTTVQLEAGAFLRATTKLVLLLYALVLAVSLALVAFDPLVVTVLYVLLSVAVLAALVEMTLRARQLPKAVRRRHAAAWRVSPPTIIALSLPALTGGWPLAAPALVDAVFLVGALAFFVTGGLLLFAFDLAGVERLAAEDPQHSRSVSTAPARGQEPPNLRGGAMWTFTSLLALGLFLFGTTFLWMTPAMAGTTPPPTGTAWTLTNVLCFAAVLGFTLAAWAVFRQYSWWDTAALVSGVVGLVAVVPFAVAQSQLDVGFGDLGVQINLWLHVLGSAAVTAIVLLPAAHDWVARRL